MRTARRPGAVARVRSAVAGLGLVLGLLLPCLASAQVAATITVAPPPLLVYAQPPVPGEGYIWMPGYWSWSEPEATYYWVPGTWVLAPNDGDLWTPGYWAFENAGYFWHIGYWGSQVGFYGGINYGYGYSGTGYQGGRWDHGTFRYNRAVSHVDVKLIHNAYSTPAVNGKVASHVSFNGGKAGTVAQPTASQRQFQSTEHAGPRTAQVAHETAARALPTQRATGPHGVPQVAATPKPSEFEALNVEHVRPALAVRPARALPHPAEPAPAPQAAAQPPRIERPGAPMPRPEAARAPRVEEPRPGQRAPAVRPEPQPQDTQQRKER